MTARGFVYSGDAKTLDAVRLIFEQLSVEFEQCSTRAEAVTLISKQRFDAVLVDCTEVQDATLVFNALRSSSSNQNSMTIAIVDGKSGVPTAFRLGAKMVMSKPLSLEQARSTLRNALALQRKEALEPKAAAAAVGGPSISASVGMPAAAEPAVAPKPLPAKGKTAFTDLRSPATTRLAPSSGDARFAGETAPADVIAERAEGEAAKREIASTELSASSAGPSFGMLESPAKKTNPMVFVALALLFVGGGVYFAWTTQPNLRNQAIAKFKDAKNAVAGRHAPSPEAAPATVAPPTTVAPSQETQPVADGFLDSPAAGEGAAQGSAPKPLSTAPPAPSVATPAAASTTSAGDVSASDLASVPEDVADAHVAFRVPPITPEHARRSAAKATVSLLAKINADGSVASYTVLSGQPQFTPAAIEAVRQWRYQPYYRNGQPAPFQTQITIPFPYPTVAQ